MLVLRRDPAQFGYECSRWQLNMLSQSCAWLNVTTVSGLSQLLTRLGISYKRGRDYVHSPDPNYDAKCRLIADTHQRVLAEPDRYVLLYHDELTYYRQPTLAQGWEVTGRSQPLARRSLQANTHFRTVADLNALTGQVTYRQWSRTSTKRLASFWYDIRAAYPCAEMIYVVMDNWPVHYHPDVLAPLQAQHFPFPRTLPANWPTDPTGRTPQDNLPIQLLSLPTYASWLNPIEKLWRWLKQQVLHLHRLSDNWPALRQRVDDFLAQFAHGSLPLLKYVGLLPA